MIPVCCEGNGIPVCPSCLEHLVAVVTIIDYYPNNGGTTYLIHSQECCINMTYCIDGVVDCNSSGSGYEMLVLYADISCTREPVTSVSTTCSFYVNCGGEPTPTPSPTPPPAPVCYDSDRDGYTTCAGDCNDYDPTVHPGAQDICDEIDNDCDGEIDEDCLESVITLEVSPESVNVEETVLVSGALSPPRAADIHLIFTKPDNAEFTTVVNSNEEGAFLFPFKAESPGTWSVSASAEGSSLCKAAASDKIFFTVEKIKPSLSLKVDSTLLYPYEEVNISGNLSPPMVAYITLIIEDEKGHTQERVVSSRSDGTFSLSYGPDSVGKWSVSAQFDGNDKYENADSNSVFFTVTREESAISVNIFTENEEIVEGNPIEITGKIRPPRSTTVLIYLENENGEELSFQVLSKEDGTFSHFFTPESPGMWSLYAYTPEEALYTDVKSDIFSFPVEPAVPDLGIFNLIVDPSSVEPGGPVRIHFQVENLGNGAAERITVRVSVNTEMERIIIHEQQISRINASSWMNIDVDWIALSGVDTILVEIDPLDYILEVSEDNNKATHAIDIAFKEDIAISEVTFSPDEMKGGEPVTITVRVQCEGEILSPFWIEFWDGERGKGSKIAAKVLSNPSEETLVEVHWTPEPGDHYICVVADTLDVIHEFDEDNNSIKNKAIVKEAPPLVEATLVVATATSAGIYWYLKDTARSLSRIGKKITKPFHKAGEPIKHASRVSRALQPARYPGGYPLSPAKDLLLKAGESIAASETAGKLFCAKGPLLKAAESTAATEIGAKLYRALYSRYYHWNKAQPVDFERAVQHKLDLLERVITHLFVFEGYIDTEEFCRFFNVDELELLEILDFLYRNGYIERVAT